MKKILILILCLAALFIVFITSCSQSAGGDKYRDYYEIFVRTFYDSDGDGKGDLQGVIEKLDYLNNGKNDGKSLQITGIWFMPLSPSPTYHKYDVTDYMEIDPEYGTMEDFEELLRECGKRGINVIIDLVLNHSSSRHPWFLSARESLAIDPCGAEVCIYEDLCREHNKHVGYYNFHNEPGPGRTSNRMPSGWFYEAFFWGEMPDLNLTNEDLLVEIEEIVEFWLGKGVGGFRLDAVQHFFDERTAENVEFLNWFMEICRKYNEDVYVVAEVWNNAVTITRYYSSTVDSFFNFPFAENDGHIRSSILNSTGERLAKRIADWQSTIRDRNPDAIDAPFLSNHDNNRSIDYFKDLESAKLAASVYLLMPGNPFIYYGEEIGMTGSGRDENKRQPMVWSVNDSFGMTRRVPDTEQRQSLDAGVFEQLEDPGSLLNHYIAVLAAKRNHPEIARGEVTAYETGVRQICFYGVEYNGKTVYIVHNLSDTEQTFELPQETSPKSIANTLHPAGGESKINGTTITIAARGTLIMR
ncbi:MAG: alpha-amylase family glycosyl hydrolase [Oscillospiraceae bacterium]|nr:alpha-amylase family glycosyl hydrolase [Oscillospiraceae bacterium]